MMSRQLWINCVRNSLRPARQRVVFDLVVHIPVAHYLLPASLRGKLLGPTTFETTVVPEDSEVGFSDVEEFGEDFIDGDKEAMEHNLRQKLKQIRLQIGKPRKSSRRHSMMRTRISPLRHS